MTGSLGGRSRILIIDDSVDTHRLLKIRLRDANAELLSAGSAQEGLALARARQPDLILLDTEMPDMHGFELLGELKNDPATVQIAVIFLSEASDSRAKVRGFDLGAVDFVTKPFDMAELKARVRSALHTQTLLKMLAQRAQLDGLTGLWNRAHLDQRLSELISTSTRHGCNLSLILADVDHFKTINDEHGHPFGDHVLQQFGQIFSEQVRDSDIACRYGGEEFAVLLPYTSAEDAEHVAERVRRQVEAHVWAEHGDLRVTCSLGIAAFLDLEDRSGEMLLAQADRALYQAKRGGRNCIVVSRPADETASAA